MTDVNEARQRLDKTLSSPALLDSAILLNLVRKQLQNTSSENGPVDQIVEKRSQQLFTLLESLRSVKGERRNKGVHGEWKLKQDNPRFRVMYREGPEGTPYHSLCLDGIIDGPMSSALVVGFEAPMYKDWWPQFTAPTFKIVESQWLQRGSVSGDLALIRFKVPWPLAMREVLLSAYELDYFDEDLIVVLYSSAPDEPDENIDGVSAADIPKLLPNVVRMELAGGFVLQRIAPDQMFFRYILMSPYVLWDVETSFQYTHLRLSVEQSLEDGPEPSMVAFRLSIVPFVKEKDGHREVGESKVYQQERSIILFHDVKERFCRLMVDMDMKLELVPPWLINFIARQLVGHGYKLYQKAVSSVKDSAFEKLIDAEPMYQSVRAAMDGMSPNLYEPTLMPMMPSEKDMPVLFKEPFKAGELGSLESALKTLSVEKSGLEHVPEDVLREAPTLKENSKQGNTLPNEGTFSEEQLSNRADFSPITGMANGSGVSSVVNGSKVVTFSPDLEKQVHSDSKVDGATDPEVIWALQVLDKLIAYCNEKKANSQMHGDVLPQSSSDGKRILRHEERFNIERRQEPLAQSPTLEPIMYGSGSLESTAALRKVIEDGSFSDGFRNGADRQQGNELPSGASTPSKGDNVSNGNLLDVKLKAEDVKPHSHIRHKVRRLFHPFRLRKLHRERRAKHLKETTEVYLK